MTVPYYFHDNLVLRSPKKNLQLTIENDNLIEELYNDKEFLEALFLASPVLYTALNKYINEKNTATKDIKKLKISLAKYYLRMSNRCTPFGLFSGCSVAQWNNGNTAIKIDTKKSSRNTRFDMHYLCALAQHLATLPVIKDALLYYPNSAWYKTGNEIRYVECRYVDGKRHHLISAVMASEYVIAILKKAVNGIKIDEIIQLLVAEEIGTEDATEFVNELIDSQVLINELEPSITGREFLYQIIKTLKKINVNNNLLISHIVNLLEKIQLLLRTIDVTINKDIAAYQQVIDIVKQLEVVFDNSKLFQTDLSFSLEENVVDIKLQQEIIETLGILNTLSPSPGNTNLKSFCKRFYERYEDAEIPLLEVLDVESGIGYLENNTSIIMPLIDDLAITPKAIMETQLTWTLRDQYLMKKLLSSITDNTYSIELDAKDLGGFKNEWDSLPPSLAVAFRILDDDRIFLENANGSSAVNLLGRFAHGNNAIHKLIKDIIVSEDEQNPNIIFAEITHLPESRIGNVLLHPAFRKYEIPFLSKASVISQNQILLQDLCISVKENSVQLRSKKLDKQIIPRLSTAHNYSFKALPVYQFLCDLQLQGKQGGIYFDWGVLQEQYKFLPRVTYKNCIVHAATWNFEKSDISDLLASEGEVLTFLLEAFAVKWKLPALLILADSDNELLINLQDKLMIEIWLDTVKNRPAFILKEFLAGTKNVPVKDESNKIYCNQFIATLLKKESSYPLSTFSETNISQKVVQQNFSLGTEWIYFKVYCGAKTADIILNEAISPLVNILLAQHKIDSFFFIRYSDPNFHLRIRFHVINMEDVWLVIQLFYRQLQPFEEERNIYKIHTDTYKRELDRYGYNTISFTENLFFYDSMALLSFLQQTEGDEREKIRWLWAVRAIDDLLCDFELKLTEKLLLMEQIKNSFHIEYNSDKFLKEQLSNKYRLYRRQIENILDRSKDETSDIFVILEILHKKSIQVRKVVAELKKLAENNKLTVTIETLLSSYIHLLINKIVAANPRVHELVIYDMLFTYYKSAVGKAKNATIKVSKEEIA